MLSLSGQVNRALLWGDDGLNSKLHQVDNNNSSTRFRIVGEARPLDDTTAGLNLETEIRPNSSATQTLTQNLPQPASAVTFTIRQAEAYIANPDFGEVRLGFGSTASYLTAEVDLSGTAVASYVQVPDFDGGFAFRQKSAARVPGGAFGSFVLSPARAYGPAVGSVFNYFDGLGRDDRIRYDSPLWDGFQFATSLLDGGAADVAGRYARQFDDFQIVGAIGLATAINRGRSQPGSYGYAGVPAGAGGISLAGTNSAPGSPTVADVSPDHSNQLDGSISVLLKSGLNLTVAGGVRDARYHDPTGRSLSPNLIFVKLGQQLGIFPVGLTALSVDFAQNEDLIFAGDVARAYGIAAVQNFDQLGLELYLAVRYETLDRSFASYHPIVAVMSGARVRF
jgi:predicted porin